MKKMICVLLLMGSILFCITGCERKKFVLSLPKDETIKSILLEKHSKHAEIVDEKEIKKLIDVLNNGDSGRISQAASIQDSPVNPEDMITVILHVKEGDHSTLYVYKKVDESFIEVPYNGIYSIDSHEYDTIDTCFTNAEASK